MCLQDSAMSLLITLFVVTLVTQCWTAPQRRNWTPQAMLYLKGARKSTSTAGRAFLSPPPPNVSAVTHNQSSDRLKSFLLDLLQQAEVEVGDPSLKYPEDQEERFNSW
uniref:Spexin hormone n=1 Tax=Echeneis naucrates TaxID=173247 RepID=A0A665WIK2_ECHNA